MDQAAPRPNRVSIATRRTGPGAPLRAGTMRSEGDAEMSCGKHGVRGVGLLAPEEAERAWFDRLARQLGLSREMQAFLEEQAG